MAQSIQAGDAVGLIGLGVMGRGVALNLIKSGFKTYGRDVNPESLTWLESVGGIAAKDAQD
jgi:L-threonate 2-dehydrogenase